jgi:hypothetical protein
MRKGSLLAMSALLTCLVQEAGVRAEGSDDGGMRAAGAREVGAAGAPRAQSDEAALAHKVGQVLAEARDEAVRAPAKQAELALARAQSSQDVAAKARQLAIAHAALALAEARAALLRERELFSSTSRRRLEAARRAQQARTLLKQAEQPCASCSPPSAAPTNGQP